MFKAQKYLSHGCTEFLHHEKKEFIAHVPESKTGDLIDKRKASLQVILDDNVQKLGEQLIRHVNGKIGVRRNKHIFVFRSKVEIPFKGRSNIRGTWTLVPK